MSSEALRWGLNCLADDDLVSWLYGNEGWQATFDTAAVYTEPILNTWGIPFHHIETDADTPKIAEAFKQAQEISRPVAALICVEYNE